MKKILAILLVLVLVFACCACGGAQETDKKDDKKTSSPAASVTTGADDDDETESSELVLVGDEELVVVAKKGSGLTLESIKDIKGKKVAVCKEGDGQAIAKYYGAVINGPHGTEHDAFSTLAGGEVQFVICRKSTAGDSRVEIALDPIVIE